MKSMSLCMSVSALALLVPATAFAQVSAVGTSAFGAGSTLSTFSSQVNNGEVNGTTVDGILYTYSLGNGQLVFDGGPGVTNNVDPLNIVSVGSNAGILTMTLPGLSRAFGYGFALLVSTNVPIGTTISLFNGVTPIGSLSYSGSPDPTFAGGFAGIQSVTGFNRVTVTFNSTAATAFALDNVRTMPVPEPTTWALFGLGLAAVAVRRRQLRKG
ncbi:MAG: PEP-CTERM sorting domain-containing protein [Rubrivivax sp.]